MQEKAIEIALKKNKNTFNPIGNADVVKSTSMMVTRPTTYRLSPEVLEEANVEVEDIADYIIIEGTVKNRHLTILVDFKITYNFIDKSTVKETGHKMSYYPPVRVTVSDRNYVMCTSHCQGFSWKM
ncbi:hypothetical protein KY289_030696 [Solanum tuberosum]|nr:hypothetical protein KY289_030696 [Solanum tuberosum]